MEKFVIWYLDFEVVVSWGIFKNCLGYMDVICIIFFFL